MSANIPQGIPADELQDRIAIARSNLAQLVEQASASSGSGDDELAAQRIANQQDLLDALVQRQDALRSNTQNGV